MLAWLLVTSYSIVVFPWFALSYYWFWIFLLPIPLTVYAGHGLEKLGVFARKLSKKVLVGFVLVSVIGVGYASSVISVGYPVAYTYMPSGLVSSCVDFEDVPDIQEAFVWVNNNLPEAAVVIVPEKLQGFSSMYLRSDIGIRIAPALLSLNQVKDLVEMESGIIYAVYFTNEVEESNSAIQLLLNIRNVGIYRI
jgi:hypothetical protein